MNELRTYSERAAAIAEILGSVLDLSKYVVNTYASNPQDLEMTKRPQVFLGRT